MTLNYSIAILDFSGILFAAHLDWVDLWKKLYFYPLLLAIEFWIFVSRISLIFYRSCDLFTYLLKFSSSLNNSWESPLWSIFPWVISILPSNSCIYEKMFPNTVWSQSFRGDLSFCNFLKTISSRWIWICCPPFFNIGLWIGSFKLQTTRLNLNGIVSGLSPFSRLRFMGQWSEWAPLRMNDSTSNSPFEDEWLHLEFVFYPLFTYHKLFKSFCYESLTFSTIIPCEISIFWFSVDQCYQTCTSYRTGGPQEPESEKTGQPKFIKYPNFD